MYFITANITARFIDHSIGIIVVWAILTLYLAYRTFKKSHNGTRVFIQILCFISLYLIIKEFLFPILYYLDRETFPAQSFPFWDQFYIYPFYRSDIWASFFHENFYLFFIFCTFSFFWALRYKSMRRFRTTALVLLIIPTIYILKILLVNYIFSYLFEYAEIPPFLFVLFGHITGYLCFILLKRLKPEWIKKIDASQSNIKEVSYEMGDL